MKRFVERRSIPANSLFVVTLTTGFSVLAALCFGALLFLPLGVNPLHAYGQLFEAGFATSWGIGFTLVKAGPLIFVGLATIVAWRSGFVFLGFEGCLLIGAASSTAFALQFSDAGLIGPISFYAFFPLVILISMISGGAWAGIVGVLKSRLGGNEVVTSLMMNYVAIFFVQYLVSGPLRAVGDLPVSPRLPLETWLPLLFDGLRANAGIVLALITALGIWLLFVKSRLGYELVVTGSNPVAARYAGINVGARQVIAAFIAGGLAALAGMVEILGVQHRLLDGMAEGTGFVGIVTALLGKLNPLGTVAAAILYAGMSVGADAMQRQSAIPTSVVFIVQSLIVLFVLASDELRCWSIKLPSYLRGSRSPIVIVREGKN